MSESGAMLSTPIIQTMRKRNPQLSALTGGVLGAVCWAVTALFMLLAWPYHGISYSPEAAILYPMLFPVFGFVSGAMLGVCIGWLAAVASRAVEPRMSGGHVGALAGAFVGASAGAIAVGVMLLWEQRNAGGILSSMLLHVGFLKRPLLIQFATGMLPGIVCGIVGARPQTTTTTTCAACGGFVRSDAAHCKHCGVAFAPVNKPSRWKSSLKWVAISGGLLLSLFGVATWLQAQSSVAVPELDSYTLDVGKAHGEHTKAELVAVLGEPPVVYHAGGGADEWAYPVRIESWSSERATPAPMLEVAFDQEGLVEDWGFFHPTTYERLPIRESVTHAHQWLDEHDVRQESRVDLEAVLKKGMTKREVLIALAGPSHNMPYLYDVPELERVFTRPAATGQGEVLRFYVDRPSPSLIPPFLYIRIFDESGNSPFGYFSGY